MEQDALLTSTEVGQLIGRSGRTVSRLADSGRLPYAQRLAGPNGAYLFRRADVDTFLAAVAEPVAS